MPSLVANEPSLAHADRLKALGAPARLRTVAFAAKCALQRLLSAIVLPGMLLAMGPLTLGLAVAVSRLSRLMALAVPMTGLARLGAMRVLAMPVRSAVVAPLGPGVRLARAPTVRMLARLGSVRLRAMAA